MHITQAPLTPHVLLPAWLVRPGDDIYLNIADTPQDLPRYVWRRVLFTQECGTDVLMAVDGLDMLRLTFDCDLRVRSHQA